MDEQEKQAYRESYQRAKEKGVPFFPNALFKDAIVSLLVFLALVALAALLGAPLEAHADPSDTSYTPRPEWYFMFLFQLLKYFPGRLEAPPPAQLAAGDPTAALYTENCSSCHGPRIAVPEGVNLHQVIAQGRTDGHPAG